MSCSDSLSTKKTHGTLKQTCAARFFFRPAGKNVISVVISITLPCEAIKINANAHL